MTRIAHALTLAAMGATAAALASWVPVWWLGVLVALVIDGAWWTAAQYERRMVDAGADARPVTRLTWGIAGLSTVLLVVHAVETASIAWAAVAVLPLVSRALTWVHSLWEGTELTPGALSEIREHRQRQRDAVAVDRARLRSETATECARLAEVSTAAESLASERAAALDRMERAREMTAGSRSLAAVPTGWTLPTLGPVATVAWAADQRDDRRHTPVTPPVTAEIEPPADRPLSGVELDMILATLRTSEDPPLSYRAASAAFRAAGYRASEVELRAAWSRVTDTADRRA